MQCKPRFGAGFGRVAQHSDGTDVGHIIALVLGHLRDPGPDIAHKATLCSLHIHQVGMGAGQQEGRFDKPRVYSAFLSLICEGQATCLPGSPQGKRLSVLAAHITESRLTPSAKRGATRSLPRCQRRRDAYCPCRGLSPIPPSLQQCYEDPLGQRSPSHQ